MHINRNINKNSALKLLILKLKLAYHVLVRSTISERQIIKQRYAFYLQIVILNIYNKNREKKEESAEVRTRVVDI